MGCHRCGRRQVDPGSGPSAWRRAVVAGEQVLVCPDCQVEGWTEGLDRCSTCQSTALVKRLGEISCRGCGATRDNVAHDAGAGRPGRAALPPSPAREALAADVAAALDRVLRGQS